MLLNLFRDSSIEWNLKLPLALLSLISVLISLTVHEISHGLAAEKCGDPTARNLGRLSLNPIHHLDLFGTLCMLLFGFGWAKPVPVNSRYFKKPKRDMALVALAGPVSNFLMAFVMTFLWMTVLSLWVPTTEYGANTAQLLSYFMRTFVVINLSFGVFNLIPIPPLDGSRILFIFLPAKYYFGLMKYERYISIIFLALLWSGVFSGFLSTIVSAVFRAYVSLFSLLPFIG